ncbi:MAG: hypothetical protein ACRD4X_06110 [Candidatus Acidiferrales bacterium]
MNISPLHTDSLRAFGYTDEEARFLYIVATHSGYFMARQFLGFTGSHWGKRTTSFWQKLQAKNQVRRECYPISGIVYHLFSRKLYSSIEKENLRNRRAHELEFIRRRIAMLDFVLVNQDHRYLETETEKVRFFSGALNIENHYLPSKLYLGKPGSKTTVHYFVDKLPMFFADSSPVVTFTYIHESEPTFAEFTHHLNDYIPLFQQLSEFRFLYVSREDSRFDKASEIFHSLVKIPLESDIGEEVLRYFHVRKAWDEKQYAAVTETDLIFRNQARSRFGGDRFEAFYRGWKSGRITEEVIRRQFPANERKRRIAFGTFPLKKIGIASDDNHENQ